MVEARPTVRVTEIGEYVRHRSCERRFKLGFNNRQLAKELPFSQRLFNTLDPVLQQAGGQREREWELSLQSAGLTDLTVHEQLPEDSKETWWSVFAEHAQAVASGQRAYGREVRV